MPMASPGKEYSVESQKLHILMKLFEILIYLFYLKKSLNTREDRKNVKSNRKMCKFSLLKNTSLSSLLSEYSVCL